MPIEIPEFQTAHDARIKSVESGLADIRADFAQLETKLDTKFTQADNKMDVRFSQVFAEIKSVSKREPFNWGVIAVGLTAFVALASLGYMPVKGVQDFHNQRLVNLEQTKEKTQDRALEEAERRGEHNEQLRTAIGSVKELDSALQREMRLLDAGMEDRITAAEERAKDNSKANREYIEKLEAFRLEASNLIAILQTKVGMPNGLHVKDGSP